MGGFVSYVLEKMIERIGHGWRGDLQVNGETLYMKIQKPGRANGGWKTPLKVKHIENINVAIFPAVSASGNAAIIICAKVLAKTKNCTSNNKIRPWRCESGMPPRV